MGKQVPAELIRAFLAHVARPGLYEKWDQVVECWGVETVREVLGDQRPRTVGGIMRALARTNRVMNERRQDVLMEVF